MDFSDENYEPKSTPKLSLTKLPTRNRVPLASLTPPPHAAASVPFQWEEAPGKPLYSTAGDIPPPAACRSLDLPPRLQAAADLSDDFSRSSMSSFSSFRSLDEAIVVRIMRRESKEGSASFSPPLTPAGGEHQPGLKDESRSATAGAIGKGNLDFSFSFSLRDGSCNGGAKKVARGGRRSRSSLLTSSHTSSRLLTRIYESFKHAVPLWRKKA
ncbi:hypothetical protein DM860_010973 [Cuscuta australis]|uniref:Uncharacterized protein n=1 Tax=Cuscuta australis TaxID=267555 RepID=A0A328E4W8_9ASTE|nr:hypothetical protein DM860_010973 [Cuscuta australis]